MRRNRAAAAVGTGGVLAVALAVLTACGDDGTDPVADTSSVAAMLLTSDDAPDGYGWNSVAEVLSDADDDLGQQLDAAAAGVTTDPSSCAALVPTSDSIIAELYDHRDSSGAVEFLPDDTNDPTVIDAVVSASDDGDTADLATGAVDTGSCATFSRTGSDGTVTNYRADAQKTAVAEVDDATVITVVSDSTEPGEDLVTTVAGTVDGVHFRVTAAGTADPDLITGLAEKQVATITAATEGQD